MLKDSPLTCVITKQLEHDIIFFFYFATCYRAIEIVFFISQNKLFPNNFTLFVICWYVLFQSLFKKVDFKIRLIDMLMFRKRTFHQLVKGLKIETEFFGVWSMAYLINILSFICVMLKTHLEKDVIKNTTYLCMWQNSWH